MTARISSRVKSGCLAIRAKIQSECSSNGETLPPLRFGAALPVSLQRWHHRITELTPTLKISAISRRDAPLSTASTARSRKSVEYGLGIDLAPQANQFPQIRLGDSGWESLRFNADGKCSRPPHLPHCHCERDRTDTNFGVNGRALLPDYAEPNEPTIPREEGFGLEQTRLALAGEYQGRFGIESDRAAPPRGGEIAQLNTNE